MIAVVMVVLVVDFGIFACVGVGVCCESAFFFAVVVDFVVVVVVVVVVDTAVACSTERRRRKRRKSASTETRHVEGKLRGLEETRASLNPDW
jgi:uncharacterized membrane protein YhiD involved in acid resistance